MHKEDGNYTPFKEKFYRIIPTRKPRINLYEDIVSENELEILYSIEIRTNSRIREEYNETKRIKDADKYTGKNAHLINSAFLYYSNAKPTRFSNGSYGVFYCAEELECAIEETKYHRLKFLQSTNEKTATLQMSVLVGNLEGRFCDIRNKPLVKIYYPDDYTYSQEFGLQIKKENKDGVAYDSVRYKSGTCYAILKPNIIKKIREIQCLNYILDNGKIVVEKISP